MRMLKSWLVVLVWMSTLGLAHAYIGPEAQKAPRPQPSDQINFRENCDNSTQGEVDQDINNVRARLLNGGDVWWDGNNGRYVVPKPPPGVPEVSSIFAGAVWLGGRDPGGNLKVAAQQYGRSSGNFDFYPGPLVPEGFPNQGTVEKDTCARWDRIFEVNGLNVEQHVRNWRQAQAEGRTSLDPEEIPLDVLTWPATGNRFFFSRYQFELPNTSQGLAGFWDQNFNGIYEPDLGDYPIVEIRGCLDREPISSPDQMFFWIYNDAGNAHNQSGSALRIQMEVQVQAFAYRTTDDINNMTFQRYKLINRAKEDIQQTFFAMWIDPDLGCDADDYVGCDVSRSLAYVYNVDAVDGDPGITCPSGAATYGPNVPILGVDYFRGPLDEFGEELGMSSFTYFNRAGTTPAPLPGTIDPDNGAPQQFYNYMSGRWKDGTPYTFGGSGYNPGSTDTIRYAFVDAPNDNRPDAWSMCSEGLPAGDRRTIQASGPFVLQPGAVNELIIGAVWVPDQVYPCPNISRLQKADDIAQDLFDACFDLPRGPDAPNVDWVELDREVIAVFTNDTLVSNNANEAYAIPGLGIPEGVDSVYRFEGYKLFQLSGPNVTLADRDDPSKVRQIYQVDLRNNIDKVFNWSALLPDDNETPTGTPYFVPELQVNGENTGIRHTFRITTDAFAEGGDVRLVNHKKYYFAAVAYAYNEYEEFDPQTGDGQIAPYLEGDRNVGDGENSFYTVIPRPILDRNLNSVYGQGAVITRLAGVGNGGNFLDIDEETRAAIEAGLDKPFTGEITYEGGQGPIDVRVYNPLEVKDGEYELTFVDPNMGNSTLDVPTTWVLRSLTDPAAPVITSERPITQPNEQVIRTFGISVLVNQVEEVGATPFGTNGAVGYEEEYLGENPTPWIAGIPDNTVLFTGAPSLDPAIFDYVATELNDPDYDRDPLQRLSTIGPGYFIPYFMADWRRHDGGLPYITPAWTDRTNSNNIVRQRQRLANVNNVDIVLTSDKSKWSRCVVVETANVYYDEAGFMTQGGRTMLDLRAAPSVGKEAGPDGNALPDGDGEGMGWFPGYAIDVETGQRLNIFFGENSTYDGSLLPAANNGTDMIWNPSAVFAGVVNNLPPNIYNYVAGGQHFIYVTSTAYDAGAALRTALTGPGNFARKVNAIQNVTWAGIILNNGAVPMRSYANGLIPNDVIIKLRVDNPFQVAAGTGVNNGYPTYRFRVENSQATELSAIEIDEALKQIQVVPNPYYGFSEYEDSQFENIVKITNLPAKCVVTIYSLEGKFIRQYNRDETAMAPPGNNRGVNLSQVIPDLEWDIKNFKGIPVASGVYLIHVAAPGLGERTIKWFGVGRAFDPSGL